MNIKEKIGYVIVGILIGAILTTGVFLIINKNKKPTNQFRTDGNGSRMNGNFDPSNMQDFDPSSIPGAQRSITEDGAERYDLPDGGVIMRRGQ